VHCYYFILCEKQKGSKQQETEKLRRNKVHQPTFQERVKPRKMAAKPDDKSTDIPDRLYDSNHRKTYKRMRFFGKVRLGQVPYVDSIWKLAEDAPPPAQIYAAAFLSLPCAFYSCCCFHAMQLCVCECLWIWNMCV